MLHIESPHQGIYAPLSQAMTDSDSEEQLFLRQQQPHQNKRLGNRNPPDSLALNQHQPQLVHFKRQQNSQRKLMQHEQLQRQQKYQLSAQTSLDSSLHQPSSYTTNMQNTFRSVMMSDGGEPGSNFSSFNSDYDDRNTADNVAILGSSGEAKDAAANQPMSPARRCCFGASLLLCFLAIVGFVWLVPCTEEGTCPAPVDRIKTHNWLSNYTKIELKGGVHVVNGLRSWENNLIFLYRGDLYFPESREGNTKPNGIISLIGSSGAVAWYDEIHDEPVAIDCTLLDVDRNGQTDCLVIDDNGELGTINPISGQWHWRYKERSAHKINSTDFPVILPDLDGDGVLEILIVASAELAHRTKALASRKGDLGAKGHATAPRNFLRILSGRNGAPIGEGFEMHECDALRKLQLDSSSQTVTFICQRNNTEARHSKKLAELFALITNKSMGVKMTPLTSAEISQHHQFGQRKDVDAQRNIYSLSGRELVVENRGKCPEDCNVTFILSDGRDGKVKVLRNFTQVGVYGMAPVQWHFKNSKPEMSGFVMKFWKWDISERAAQSKNVNASFNAKAGNDVDTPAAAAAASPAEADVSFKKSTSAKKTKAAVNALKDNATKSNKASPHQNLNNHANKTHGSVGGQWNHVHTPLFSDTSAFDRFEHRIQKRETHTLPNGIRHSANATKHKSNGSSTRKLLLDANFKMETITETVILVLFIGADTRIENTSQSNIVQFCRNETNEWTCQPDLNNQENSILIADLDQDGSQELVSYTSTFVPASDDGSLDYKLITYVRLLRLQSELPAFYGKDKNN